MAATFASVLLDEAVALHRRGAVAEAAVRYAEVLRGDPRNVDALSLSALAALQQRRFGDSIEFATRALALNKDHALASHTRAGALISLGRYAEALPDLDRVIAAEPRNGKAHADRGVALYGLDRLGEAVDALEHGQRLAPEDHDVAFNLANAELLLGRWHSGFQRYERRLTLKPAAYPPLPFPLWQGEPPAANTTLLLQAEQGFGDTILFARFAAHLATEGYRVVLLAGPKLKALLSTLPGVIVITGLDEIDQTMPIRWQRLMSLPALLGITPDTIPGNVRYLGAEPQRVARWRDIGEHGFKIGIAWTGSATGTAILRNRFMPLAAFAPIADIPGVRLISLQKGAGSEQAATVPFRVETLGDDFDAGPDAFVDTAAAMQSLDLIVTCDSAVGHLAGALGRPTFTALAYTPFWPWLLDRDDTPWYPGTRLFRQTTPGDWGGVFARLAAAVRRATGAAS